MRLAFISVIAAMAALLLAPAAAMAQAGAWCPMHPDVRGAVGERCPICGMALVPRPADLDAYWLDLADGSRAPRAGRPETLRFVIRNPHDDRTVRAFTMVHDRNLHLFVISHDLEFFAHLHPELSAGGTFAQSVTLPKPGAYRLIADVEPTGAAPQVLQKSIVTAGYRGSLRPAAAPAADVSDKTVDGLRIALIAADPVAGREQLVTFEVDDAATGQPVENLEPFLGAPAHLLIVSSDLQTAMHSHPVVGLSSTAGPRIAFQVLFPRAGAYRMWVQVQRHNRVSSAAFTVYASHR
jgi:hypothetical protein